MDGDLRPADTRVEPLDSFGGPDLHDLCDAADAAIVDGGGFGWLSPPPRALMESYWRGVLLIPERKLFVARLDGAIAGSAQLVLPTSNNEAGASSGTLTTFFVAPWARGYGLALRLVETVEAAARGHGLRVINLDVRESQARAIQIYEQLGYVRWGCHPRYALLGDTWMRGFHYYKDLVSGTERAEEAAP